MSLTEMILRISLATVVSGLIGFDRELKHRPAGIRTHILVCIGAAIIAMIQEQISFTAIEFAKEYPDLQGVIRSDEARLIAQVVSGIGFLGAGTIIVTKRSVQGLTTAASLWTVAGLGLAIGMGFYRIGVLGSILILIVLSILNRIIRPADVKYIEIRYVYSEEAKQFIDAYFSKQHLIVKEHDVDVDLSQENPLFRETFRLEVPLDFSDEELLRTFIQTQFIQHIRMRKI
ncbi:MgtC/SapB family protein [Enterococcus olivae]